MSALLSRNTIRIQQQSGHDPLPSEISNYAPTARNDVVFSHLTALQIVRTACLRDNEPNTSSFILSENAPGISCIRAATKAMKSECPGIAFRAPVHYLVRSSSRHSSPRLCRRHQHAGTLPRESVLRIARGAWCVTPELAFVQEAAIAKDRMSLILLGWELCGSYCTDLTGRDTAYDLRPLTTRDKISEFARHNPQLRGSQKAIEALRYIADGSASPRESMLALALGLPLRDGGHALGMPVMNYRVEASEQARIIADRMSFRCDLCWPDMKLDIEYQSHESHANEESRISDSRRANALASMGWTVIAITNDELDSVSTLAAIAETARKHLHRRARPRFKDHYARHIRLRRTLGLPVRE